jgi:hypothetical protein
MPFRQEVLLRFFSIPVQNALKATIYEAKVPFLGIFEKKLKKTTIKGQKLRLASNLEWFFTPLGQKKLL